MRTPHLITLPAAALLALGLSACGSANTPPSPATPTASASSTAGAAVSANGVDVMFLQMMIPHHAQALDLADLAPARSQNSDVLGYAAQIGAAQAPEITQMREWFTAWGQPVDSPHSDHMMMDGMLTSDQMAAIVASHGPAFDRAFLNGMIAHHEGAVAMATDVLAYGKSPDVKALATEIIDGQTAEIADMTATVNALPQ